MKNHYRTNRTMIDAFGPYAVLYVKPESFFKRAWRYFWSMFK